MAVPWAGEYVGLKYKHLKKTLETMQTFLLHSDCLKVFLASI